LEWWSEGTTKETNPKVLEKGSKKTQRK